MFYADTTELALVAAVHGLPALGEISPAQVAALSDTDLVSLMRALPGYSPETVMTLLCGSLTGFDYSFIWAGRENLLEGLVRILTLLPDLYNNDYSDAVSDEAFAEIAVCDVARFIDISATNPGLAVSLIAVYSFTALREGFMLLSAFVEPDGVGELLSQDGDLPVDDMAAIVGLFVTAWDETRPHHYMALPFLSAPYRVLYMLLADTANYNEALEVHAKVNELFPVVA